MFYMLFGTKWFISSVDEQKYADKLIKNSSKLSYFLRYMCSNQRSKGHEFG